MKGFSRVLNRVKNNPFFFLHFVTEQKPFCWTLVTQIVFLLKQKKPSEMEGRGIFICELLLSNASRTKLGLVLVLLDRHKHLHRWETDDPPCSLVVDDKWPMTNDKWPIAPVPLLSMTNDKWQMKSQKKPEKPGHPQTWKNVGVLAFLAFFTCSWTTWGNRMTSEHGVIYHWALGIGHWASTENGEITSSLAS